MDSKKLKLPSFDMLFPTREQFLESCKPQEFSLPKPIMKYIWENPSTPEIYLKLIKCCELFFVKNPILIVKNLQLYSDDDNWQYCSEEKCGGYSCWHEHKKFNIKLLKDNKIWVSERFAISPNQKSKLAADLIPKIHRFDIEFLQLLNQILSYDQFKFLAAGVRGCHLGIGNKITYDNGEYVPLEDIMKLVSGAKKVCIDLPLLSTNSACKSYADFVDACNSIEKLDIYGNVVHFNIQEFYQHLKVSKNRALIYIHSRDAASYNRVGDLVNEIFAAESFDFVPPVITYFMQHKTQLNKMKEIQEREAAKYH